MTGAGSQPDQARWPLVLLAFATLVYGWILFTYKADYATAADGSGYLNAARLIPGLTIM